MSGIQHPDPRKRIPNFPVKQMTILALCRICEPIAFMSIFPYVYYMIQDFNITDRPEQIPVYAGMVTSAFAFAEFSSGVAWGRLSDKVGRKPVLLTGLAGTALSMLVFGFAPNLPVALLARALGGLLNGNIGVLQTTVAEMVTVKEHQPRAYTIMPFVWCLGSILGPMLGGALAKPVDNLPQLFSPGSIWETFPYLLPNLVCTIIVSFGVLVGILFLEETHEEKKYRRDPGLETGKWLINKIATCVESKGSRHEKVIYTTGRLKHCRLWHPSLVTVETVLPFKFVGGYGLSTKEIGVVLSIQGIYSMIATVFLFPIIVRRLGALGLFRLIAISYPILYIGTPYLVLLPDELRMVGVYAVVIWKCTFSTMAYPSNAILLTNSAPSLLLLGTINGVAASTASLCRAFGPTVSGVLFTAGLSVGYSGLAWWCSALICVGGAILSLSMTDAGGRMDVDEKNEEPELGFEDHILDHNALDTAIAAAEPRGGQEDDDIMSR
ncbi:major facilitator superfamily domain-containing protein [Amylocarpus encephaloides]|uniref:Major facilitator superfamily domain-containing protein n=1 Tax=Amylocarpus encephaloides TaxID=45428 RepID=A0A9P7YNH2_9HELO|nr:major facilitator superfamily domain-containing protein [Amylocarpus encephaloides]